MKDITFNPNEIKFMDGIQEFFGTRTVKNHLTFIDKWMELLLGGKFHKRWTKPGDLYFFYERIEVLFQVSHQLHQTPKSFVELEASATVDKDFLAIEKQLLTYFPHQLKKKELLNPLKAIRAVFKEQDLQYYQQTLKEWVAEGLNDNCATENADYIIPLYTNAKKLIAACWLIHERVATKNSFKSLTYPNPLFNFALTEPFLFNAEEVNDPYSVVESFFNFTNLSGYREELQKCFIAAITERLAHEKPSTLFFIHNQYISLIQAGYIIVSKKISYVPKPNKYAGKTLGQWMLDVRDKDAKNGELDKSDEAPHLLSMQERANPLAYCSEILTDANLVKLRFGLSEWLGAGLSCNTSIDGLDYDCAFGLYLTLQKLTEAFYLIITANAKTPTLPLTVISHEV